MKNLIVLIFFTFIASKVSSQTKTLIIDRAYEEMNTRGINEDELKAKLELRGIDLDAIKEMEPNEMARYQAEIEGAINEIEQEKKLKSKKSALSNIKQAPKKQSVSSDTTSKNKRNNKLVLNEINTDTTHIIKSDSFDKIEIWGQHIFKNNSLPIYKSSTDIKAPDNYILGVGDQITVAIWGISQLNEVYEINSEGYITPSRMPRIFLKGTSFGRAKSMLNNYFRRFYRFNSNQFSVSVAASRMIQVNIVGEVEKYGSYTIPAINTAFNALVVAGGPNKIGSVRKINIVHNGIGRIVDAYKFLMDPANAGKITIENNDYIQVPTAGRVVKIKGSVNRPFKYELIEGEELAKLIYYSGGLKEDAITNTIQLERFENDKKIILDIPYKDLVNKKGDFKLKNGDIVTIFSVRTQSEDFIFVKGEVRSESSFNYSIGMTMADLVKKIDFTYESDLTNAFLRRNNPDKTVNLLRVNLINVRKGGEESKILLQPLDELEIFKLSTYSDRTSVTVSGAVRKAGRFSVNLKEDLKVKDLVLLAGGLKSEAWDNAYLFRSLDQERKNLQVIKLPILDIMKKENSDKNIFVNAYDSLVILSGLQFEDFSYIEISGAVNSPGKYQYSKSLKLKDAIALAAGFTFSAASNKIDVYRIQILDNQPTRTIVKTIDTKKNLLSEDEGSGFDLEPFDVVVIRNQPNFEMQKIVNIEGEVLYPGPYAIINSNERISDIVKRAGGLTPEAFQEGATIYRSSDNVGYIIMDLKEAMKAYTSRNNIFVKDKDFISIPKRKDFVRISGETNASSLYPDKLLASNNSVNVAYFEGKRANYYIKNFAAGLNENGDRSKITVEHANGRIESTKRTIFGRIYPKVYKGSIINVGAKDAKVVEAKKNKKDVDWTKVVADSIAQATGVLSLILLIQRLN